MLEYDTILGRFQREAEALGSLYNNGIITRGEVLEAFHRAHMTIFSGDAGMYAPERATQAGNAA